MSERAGHDDDESDGVIPPHTSLPSPTHRPSSSSLSSSPSSSSASSSIFLLAAGLQPSVFSSCSCCCTLFFQASKVANPGGCTTTHRSADRCDQQAAGRRIACSRIYCEPRLCVSQTLEPFTAVRWLHLPTRAKWTGGSDAATSATSKSWWTNPMDHAPAPHANSTASPTETRCCSFSRACLASWNLTLPS